jgi:uncharacterized protein
MPGIKQVNCPTCQKIVPWDETEPYRPFCSKKCQLIDFGDWASERNSIPVGNPLSELDEEDLDDD